jgi:hypothetical protein
VFVRNALAPRRLAALPRLLDQSLDFQEQSSVSNQLCKVEADLANRQREVGTGLASDLEYLQIVVNHDTSGAVLRQEYAIDFFPTIDAAPQLRSWRLGGTVTGNGAPA